MRLPDRSLLYEKARLELHASTPISTPSSHKPKAVGAVIYQHRNLDKLYHGNQELIKFKEKCLAAAAAPNKKKESERLDCKVCHKVFTSYTIRTDHERDIHGADANKFVCHICHRTLGRKVDLLLHLDGHEEVAEGDMVPCTHEGCKRRFNTELLMNRHKRNVHKNKG